MKRRDEKKFALLIVLMGLAFLAALVFAGSTAVKAQTKAAERGALSGVLTNASGSTLKGVNVKATESKTGQSITSSTDSAGAYVLNLPPGMYAVQFSGSGYKTEIVQNVAISNGDSLNISTKLYAGSKAELLLVQWKGQAESADLDASLSKAVPLSARNYTAASNVASGVSSQLNNATAIGINTQDVKVGSGVTNNYMTDGAAVSATAGQWADSPGIPNPDAIEMHRVQSWSYSAGPERNAGGQIMVTTKSGTDKFHGSMWEFVRNDDMNANDYFLKQAGFPEPVLKQNQFGLTLGGPALRQRAYFFVSYQGTRQRNGIDQSGFSPQISLPPFPTGERTKETVGAALCPANHTSDAYNYQTRFGGTQVDCAGNNINQVALNILNQKLPNGNYLIPGNDSGDFATHPMTVPATFQEDQYILNTDYVISPKHKVTEKFFNSRSTQLNNFTSGRISLPGTPTTIVLSKTYGVLRLASTLSPHLSNEFRVSGQHDLMSDTVHNPFKNSDVGITSNTTGGIASDTMDEAVIFGAFNFGGNGTWDNNYVNQYQLADQLSWKQGKHSWRIGFEGDRRQWNVHVIGESMGSLIFQTVADFLIGLPGCPPSATNCSTSNPVVDGVTTNGATMSNVYGSLGPTWNNAEVTGPNGVYHAYRFNDYSAYIQDTYTALPHLTLTYGLRWEYFGLPGDSTGNSTSFWPSLANAWQAPASTGTYDGFVAPSNYSGAALPAGVYQNSRRNPIGRNAPLTNFAPRIAASYQVHNNLVVNAGYGWFFDRPDAWTMDQQTQAMPPYGAPVGGVGSANYAASWANPFGSYNSSTSSWNTLARTAGWGSVARSADLTAGTTSGLMLNSLSENFTTPLTQKWSLEVQDQLPHGLTAAVGYYGGHSIHLLDSMREYNTPQLASASHPLYGITTNTVANAPLRVPYLGLAPAGLNITETQGAAKYNAIQGSIRMKMNNGVHVDAIYRFSRTLMDLGAVSQAMGTPFLLANSAMNSNNSLNARQQYGPAVLAGNAMQGMSAPQRLVLRYGWNLPWKFTGTKGVALSGWEVAGSTIMQAGTPMTITDSRGGTAYGGAGVSRAQFKPGMGPKNAASSGSIHDRLNGWFNTSAFYTKTDTFPTIDGSDATDFGNSSVGIIRGPGQNVTDLSLTKHFVLPSKMKLDFRSEFYNVFNHANFANPDLGAADFNFGQITACTVNPRIIQLGLKLSR